MILPAERVVDSAAAGRAAEALYTAAADMEDTMAGRNGARVGDSVAEEDGSKGAAARASVSEAVDTGNDSRSASSLAGEEGQAVHGRQVSLRRAWKLAASTVGLQAHRATRPT